MEPIMGNACLGLKCGSCTMRCACFAACASIIQILNRVLQQRGLAVSSRSVAEFGWSISKRQMFQHCYSSTRMLSGSWGICSMAALPSSESTLESLCSAASFRQTVLLIGRLGRVLRDIAPNNPRFWWVVPSSSVGFFGCKGFLMPAAFADMLQFLLPPPLVAIYVGEKPPRKLLAIELLLRGDRRLLIPCREFLGFQRWGVQEIFVHLRS